MKKDILSWSALLFLLSCVFLVVSGSLWLKVALKFYLGWSLIASFIVVIFLGIAGGITYLLYKYLKKPKFQLLVKQLLIFILLGMVSTLSLTLDQEDSEVNISWPAPLIPINNIMAFEHEFNSDYHLVGVYSKVKLTKLEQLFALLDSNYDYSPDISSHLSIEEQNLSGLISKQASYQSAIIAGYNAADVFLDYQYLGQKVNYKDQFVNPSLAIGDLIISINGEKFNNEDEFRSLLSNIVRKAINDNKVSEVTISLEIFKTDSSSTFVDLNLHIVDNQVMLGIGFYPFYHIITPPIATEIAYAVSGPSGGLLMSIAIYDYLTESNFTKKYKIAGTGTIDSFGRVGSIGGVKQKVITAIYHQTDYFFVPSNENANDAMVIWRQIMPRMKIIAVKTLTEAINFLEGLDD